MEIIHKNLVQIKHICKSHHVKNLFVFGSVARQKANENSDIDFLVEFDEVEPLEYFDNYLSLKIEFETLFSKKVDLVEIQTVKNPILKNAIERDKIKIYGRKNIEMLV